MGRKKKTRKDYPEIAVMIARHYDRLYEVCDVSKCRNYGSLTIEDIFSETIMYVIHDPDALKHVDVEAFIKHFQYRFKLIEFRAVQEAKQLNEISYANYLQTKEASKKG
jgi:hypothetical protein